MDKGSKQKILKLYVNCEQQILQLFKEQYNKAIKVNPMLVNPETEIDPGGGLKPMAKDDFAIKGCEVRVIYLGTQGNGVCYYQGFDGRRCPWLGLTEIEQEIFTIKQNSINQESSKDNDIGGR